MHVVNPELGESLQLPNDKRLLVIRNNQIKGFGRNHNTSFTHCVLNPDKGLRDGLF